MLSINLQLVWLFVLPIPIACIAWTVTHEEVFKEPREYCVKKSKSCQRLLQRKFFYLFTCEYCFSHYVTLFLYYCYQLSVAHAGLGWLSNSLVFISVDRQYVHEFDGYSPSRHKKGKSHHKDIGI